MRTRDTQFGKPYVLFKDTQSNIEAMPLPIGSAAYATDAEKLGYKTSSGWVWVSGGGDRIAAQAYTWATGNYTPPNYTTVIPTALSSSNIVGTSMNTSTHRFTPPADTIFVGAWNVGVTGRAYTGFSVSIYENGSQITRALTHQSTRYNLNITCYFVGLGNGTNYYEPTVYRATNGTMNTETQAQWTAWNI